MSDPDFVIFPKGLHFLNQTQQNVSFGKSRLIEDNTYFVPIYWRGSLDGERGRPKYRKIIIDTDRIACVNAFYQSDNDWVLETEFNTQNDKELLFFLQNLEDYLIEQTAIHSSSWLKVQVPKPYIEEAFKPIVLMSRRTHRPVVRWHVECEDGVPKIEVINQFRRKMFPHQFHPGMDIEVKFHLAGIKFNQNYCSAVISPVMVRLFNTRNQSRLENGFRFKTLPSNTQYEFEEEEIDEKMELRDEALNIPAVEIDSHEVLEDDEEKEEEESKVVLNENEDIALQTPLPESDSEPETEPIILAIEKEETRTIQPTEEETATEMIQQMESCMSPIIITEENPVSNSEVKLETESNETKKTKTKTKNNKTKVVKRIIKTAKGERVWTLLRS